MTLNREAFAKLIREDAEWLAKQPRTLERDHIASVLSVVIGLYYDKMPEGHRRWIDAESNEA